MAGSRHGNRGGYPQGLPLPSALYQAVVRVSGDRLQGWLPVLPPEIYPPEAGTGILPAGRAISPDIQRGQSRRVRLRRRVLRVFLLCRAGAHAGRDHFLTVLFRPFLYEPLSGHPRAALGGADLGRSGKTPGCVPGHGIFQSLQLHPRQPGHPAGGGCGTFPAGGGYGRRAARREKLPDLPEPLPRLRPCCGGLPGRNIFRDRGGIF